MKTTYCLLIFVFLFSCKKESSDIQFPKKMDITKVVPVATSRLFTNKAEITDTAIINGFVGQSKNFNMLYKTMEPTGQISFFTKDTVTFGSLTEKYSVEKPGNQFLFTSVSVVLYPNNDLNGLRRYEGERIPIVTASGILFVGSDIRVGYGNYNELYLSLFSYKLTKNSPGRYRRYSGIVFNEFNPNYISTLDQNDTLAVREFRVYFKTR